MTTIKLLTKILLIQIFSFVILANDIRNTTEKTIENIFPGDIKYEMIKFSIPLAEKNKIERKVKQQFFADELFIWKITQAGEIKGFAVLDNVLGKSLPITFLVVFDKELKIVNSSIIKYREPYGGQVGSDIWNSQFKGKNGSSNYEVGADISAISGATISVNSVSKGIQKLALLMPEIKDKL